MAAYLLWAIVGLILIIAELLTGTFYLLVFGVAALVAAFIAFMGGEIWMQVISSVAATFIGVYLIHRWWKQHPKQTASENSLEVGQTVIFEQWVDEASRTARVKYRGAMWDAKVAADASAVGSIAVRAQDVLTIRATEHGVLMVSA